MKKNLLILALTALFCAGMSAQAETQQKPAFQATHYDVSVTLNPAEQTLSARAKVDLIANEASSVVKIELHPNLNVKSVALLGGKKPLSLSFERSENNPLVLNVRLPESITVGKTVSLVFEYAGSLANEEGSPSKGVRLAYIGNDGAYLLLAARWFPLTDFPANRYTATFTLNVPNNFAAVGTGQSLAPTSEGDRSLYKFICERPEPSGTFVAGNLMLAPVKSEGRDINIYTQPDSTKTAENYGEALTKIANFFTDKFWPLKHEGITLVQVPTGNLREGYAAPGLLLVWRRQWTEKPNERLLAELAAHEWWEEKTLPASSSDVWLSGALARYSAAIYAENTWGKEGLYRALNDFAVGAMIHEDAAPIAEAGRLTPFTSEYRSVVTNKGAMVWHMLRRTVGDETFLKLLRSYYTSSTRADLRDFEKFVQENSSSQDVNMRSFFSQWLHSTGVPEFKVEYIIYRIPGGFKIVGTAKQNLEIFKMTLKVRVDTEGNSEYGSIDIAGTSSQFSIKTFGMPKSGGITIDPDNNILKSSPKLRVRAQIARGEELADDGMFYDAIREYQQALEVQKNNPLALFRMGEAFFYQKNYQVAANSFREALNYEPDTDLKWIEPWSHVYLGKIFDISGQRDRSVDQYSKVKDDPDAQAKAQEYLKEPYKEGQP